ncbi:MAG: hypothetical protein IJ446_03155 [Oscillospiraceae bacterium]|nr:hypothetical protein [Oscillospiraceae bacterium]
MNKKISAILICCALIINLSGCDKSEGSGTEQTVAVPSDTQQIKEDDISEKKYKILSDGDHSGVYGTLGEISPYDTVNTNYALTADAGTAVHDISDTLFGIFIEDINFAADGGLYAEMVQNRSFEFTELASGDERHGWSDTGDISAEVKKGDGIPSGDYLPLNENNPNYMVLENMSGALAGIANRGFLDGMAVRENETYNVSAYLRSIDGYRGEVHFALTVDGETVAEASVSGITDEWAKYEVALVSPVTASEKVNLQLLIDDGRLAADFISMFPQDTFKGRENGLRRELAEKLEALEPGFLRFPGGCVVEGNTLSLAYDWKASVGAGKDGEPLLFNDTYGDIAARRQGQNIWTDERAKNDRNPSYMSYGLGFYEYFLLAEDLDALPVPVISCGMHCMAQGHGLDPHTDSEEFMRYIQDALDLVEFCRGDSSTKWGAVRTAMGHEEPFRIKYIGIGNENWGDDFFQKYTAFAEAFVKAGKENPEMYGDIELIFTSGPDDGDSGYGMYIDAYRYAKEQLDDGTFTDITDFAGLIDHHYYNDPEWFLEHSDYYDETNYSRDTDSMTDRSYGGGIPVFLGEYAARSNNMKAALAEAAYMTGLERNGDIVKLAAYAPLFGNLTATHWAPDLIWFNNDTVTCSVNYYVQQIFARNAGNALLSSELEGAEVTDMQTLAGKVGVGTWNTAAIFDNVKIVDNSSGEVLAQDDFSADTFAEKWEKVSDGSWEITDGKLVQSSSATNTNLYATTGTAVYFGDNTLTDYTYTVDAVKTAGSEGFLIPFCVGDKKNNWFWNIGGWNNTVSCLQKVSDGVKSDQISGTVSNFAVKTDTQYKLKIVVDDLNVKCYIDDKLMIDYNIPDTTVSEAYQVVSTDDSGDIIIKLVNQKESAKTFAIDLQNAGDISGSADIEIVEADSIAADNILGKPEAVTLKTSSVSGISDKFNYTVSPYSVTVLRIHR